MPSTSLARQAYREKPVNRSFVMHQKWESLLFLHWEVDPDWVQRRLPPGLTVDTHEGKAWAGIVPFFMRNVRPRYFPSVPGLSNFMEMNVRTYVTAADGSPGVWFYSLDCNQLLAVWAARAFFHLPYFSAKMSAVLGEQIDYHCRRAKFPAASRFMWTPKGELMEPAADSLECFLLNRYLLFSWDPAKKHLFSGRVWHQPYRWGKADLQVWDQWPLIENGLPVAESPPAHVCVTEDLQVEIYPLQKITAHHAGI